MPPLNELPVRRSRPSRARATLNRRQALSALAAGLTTGLAACSKPVEQIVPYVRMPERLVPGEPLKFATTLALSGFGRGVIASSIDGRPIKIEGNPRHPASLGATDVFAEAAVLALYDPDRSRTILKDGAIASEAALRLALQGEVAIMRERQGEGFRLLTGRTTSPTLLRQIDALIERYPKAVWHAYEAVDDSEARAGATLAYGRALQAVARLDGAKIIVTLDADPLGHGPDQLRNAHGYAAGRRPQSADFSRIYSIEATPTLTGAKADHHLALHPHLIGEVAIAIANALGAGRRQHVLPDHIAPLLKQLTADLAANIGRSVVLAGGALSEQAHALVHWINWRLHAPLDLYDLSSRTAGGREGASLDQLAKDLDSGAVRQLVMLGVNPAYDAPGDVDFAAKSGEAPFRLHFGRYADETAAAAQWHVPQIHELEAWSDLRASDGTASLVQPLIRPLYGGWSEHQLLALLLEQGDKSAHEMVRDTWRGQAGNDFEAWWTGALQDGVIAGSTFTHAALGQPRLIEVPPPAPASTGITIVLRPDPCLWDGSPANNAWLQECPKPLSKQVWGNAVSLNPQEAARLGVVTGDVIRLSAEERHIELPVLVEPGVANGIAALTLGFGRRKAGAIGTGLGASAYAIRRAGQPWMIPRVEIAVTGRHEDILTTQNVVRGLREVGELYPRYDLAHFNPLAKPVEKPIPSLMPDGPRPNDGHAWAMVIDASICIGCNACVIACQAENNVPVVGPEEVARGRDMHWLRVDVYDHGSTGAPRPGFQPVPCMHCEHAPCEPVCPVAASVHDGEGLNVQVYNRCIGTRFCEANCPYKVRRFNFFAYADGEEYANLGFESYRAQRNPEVTVRARGVMEKCTYCVQRISAARRTAEREHRAIGLNEVETACQRACPTEAIAFGDLRHEDSTVSRQKLDARHYALLEHLGTRPRTSYLADIRNPAALDGDAT